MYSTRISVENQLIASVMKLTGNTLTFLATRQIFQEQQITRLTQDCRKYFGMVRPVLKVY